MELIATHSHPEYGEIWIGKKNRDEEFVCHSGDSYADMEGTTIEDLAEFIPPRTNTVHFSEDDVMDFVGEISLV